MKTLVLFAFSVFFLSKISSAQIICIYCYIQNDSISDNVTNLITNGSFENHNCTPNTNASSYCPNSSNYNCDLPGWTCTGGGYYTYASIWTNSLTYVPDGLYTTYWGNDFCRACSNNNDDTTCLEHVDCAITGIPDGYPVNDAAYGGTEGISLAQTVSGLTVGNIYVLEFWCGGEDQGAFLWNGIFAVDVGFGDTMLVTRSTQPFEVGMRYIIEFIATSTSHTIKFTNWGHICSSCTELILDNVRLYTLDQLDPSVPTCASPYPISALAASDTDVCEKFCVSFFDSSTNNPSSWQWEFPGGDPSSSTSQNPSNICYDIPGVYDVTLITTNSNGSDTLTLPDFITVYDTPPFPDITQVGYTLTSTFATTYQWQLNGIDIPGATNQSYEVLQTGFYTVVVGDENGCANSATTYVELTGIDNLVEQNLLVLPNPSLGNFTLKWINGTGLQDVYINITNAVGQSVYSSHEENVSSNWEKEIFLGTEPAGIYYLELKTENGFARKKLITSR